MDPSPACVEHFWRHLLHIADFVQWAPIAADYNCRLPANISSTKVFLLALFGLFIPITFVEILGAALMTITDQQYTNAFEEGGQAVSWDKSFLHGMEAESSSSLFLLFPSCTRLSFCLIVILNPHATVQTTSQIHIQLASLSKLSVVPSPSYRVSSGRSSLLSFILSQESPVGSTSLKFCSSHFFFTPRIPKFSI